MQMTLFGKILYTLFPKSLDRMIELDRMKDKAVTLRVYLQWHGGGRNELPKEQAIKMSKELQTLRREYNMKKMWFMRKI